MARGDACPTHCCPRHGCKYGEWQVPHCVVAHGDVEPAYPHNNGCEICEDAGIFNPERIYLVNMSKSIMRSDSNSANMRDYASRVLAYLGEL
jgi:hypothetical protein